MARIYVASSWRNEHQPGVVALLQDAAHAVYDFRDSDGFSWADIDPDWRRWDFAGYRKALRHATADRGFRRDKAALGWCDTCVLVLPCGRSAHLELGWAIGQGKRSLIYCPPVMMDAELMYLLADHLVDDTERMIELLREP